MTTHILHATADVPIAGPSFVVSDGGSIFDALNDSVTQPTDPTTGGNGVKIAGQQGGAASYGQCSFDPFIVPAGRRAGAVTLWVYADLPYYSNGNVDLIAAGDTITQLDISAGPSLTAAPQWYHSDQLGLTAPQLADMQIYLRQGANSPIAQGMNIYAAYLEIYTRARPQVWNGSSWVLSQAKVYQGGWWGQLADPRVFNGADWQ